MHVRILNKKYLCKNSLKKRQSQNYDFDFYRLFGDFLF